MSYKKTKQNIYKTVLTNNVLYGSENKILAMEMDFFEMIGKNVKELQMK
jgi:hypothetical protein